MGKERSDDGKEQDVSALLSNLHLTRDTHGGRRAGHRGGTRGSRRPMARKTELLQIMLLDLPPGDQMMETRDDVVPRESPRAPTRDATSSPLPPPLPPRAAQTIDYPMLLQISDLLRATTSSTSESALHAHHARARTKSYIALLKSCGLSADSHYAWLRQWRDVTAKLLSSPVFDSDLFWSRHVLALSVTQTALHCALLATAGLQYIRSNKTLRQGDDGIVDAAAAENRRDLQAVYRLRAEAERRLRFHAHQVDREVSVATHVTLMLFDQLTGNEGAWQEGMVATKLAMRGATYSSSHCVGRYFFWTVARHDRLAAYVRRTTRQSGPSVLDVDDLLWDDGDGAASQLRRDVSDTSALGTLDQIGVLYAELMHIQRNVANLSPHATEERFAYVDASLTRWKDEFPLDLQTYRYEGDVHDASCFLHALTCNGGARAVALHCLFSEVMIMRLRHTPTEFSKSKIHEHAMTICKLSQSLTSSSKVLHDAAPTDMNMILGALYVAGIYLFSRDGKAWLERMLRWISDISGNLYAVVIANNLVDYWREIRTRPRPIVLEEDLGGMSIERDDDLVADSVEALAMDSMVLQ